jgi:NADH:ubiquinone oxidoreductase subunit 4 (subunit M)
MESSILTILTFLPVVGVAVILLLKPLFRRETDEAIKGVALWTSIITLIVSIIV